MAFVGSDRRRRGERPPSQGFPGDAFHCYSRRIGPWPAFARPLKSAQLERLRRAKLFGHRDRKPRGMPFRGSYGRVQGRLRRTHSGDRLVTSTAPSTATAPGTVAALASSRSARRPPPSPTTTLAAARRRSPTRSWRTRCARWRGASWGWARARRPRRDPLDHARGVGDRRPRDPRRRGDRRPDLPDECARGVPARHQGLGPHGAVRRGRRAAAEARGAQGRHR